ncbi:MAG: aminodeoxychorismate synthase component I [Anaerolineales bacterium]|nr:aminodeoxychorismate synthase component I [Anaerolineales bacterium]
MSKRAGSQRGTIVKNFFIFEAPLIRTNEVLLKNNHEWLYFSTPHKILQTESLSSVRETLQEVENLVNANGWHAAGFVSYEAAPAFDSALRVLNSNGFPLIWFGLYPKPQVLKTSKIFRDLRDLADLNWGASVERENYNTAIEKIKDAIASGRTYQVNYTMRLKTDFAIDEGAWQLFLHLAKSQNKYAAYLNTDNHIICSASPELFFKLDGDRIFSNPMKGTVKRGRTTQEDKEQMNWLHGSVKNRAENVMIVDMIRNDLGKVAEIGSVHVPELFQIEKYSTLFQMTSSVQAKTKAPLTEIFSALFPCASITGAPKVSTMKIISELETTPRKVYTGSIGYIFPNRKAQFNVAIRTALIDKGKGQAEYGIGGGIVWDSASTDEYSEALLKARVLTERPQEFSLFETMLWTPDQGFFLLERHIDRMEDSADYFDFPFSNETFRNFLNNFASGYNSPKRVKVFLDRFGEFSAESKDYRPEKKVFKVHLADQPINSHDVFFFHKTTRRDIYPTPQSGFNDVLLFNEKEELTEFTIGNLVVEMNGELFTPPISCGLLAGTFRAHLLETKQIKERVIQKGELQKCTKVFLVNSLRKWSEVKI